MCRPPRIPLSADERTARRSVPATFVGCVHVDTPRRRPSVHETRKVIDFPLIKSTPLGYIEGYKRLETKSNFFNRCNALDRSYRYWKSMRTSLINRRVDCDDESCGLGPRFFFLLFWHTVGHNSTSHLKLPPTA